MATEEDILLREVDDDLKQDQTLAFFKENGPWLLGGAAIIIAGVAGLQVWRSNEARMQAQNAETYEVALRATTGEGVAPDAAAVAMREAATETSGGYAGLARLREAGFQAQADDTEGAVATLREVAADGSLPTRMQDFARLRAAALLLDSNPAEAKALSDAVTTEQMQPLADEIRAMAAMAAGDYETAYEIFVRLMEAEGSATSIDVVRRARLYAPVADAGRQGVPLEPQESEAEAFIQSFTDRLTQELQEGDEPAEDGAEAPEPEDTP